MALLSNEFAVLTSEETDGRPEFYWERYYVGGGKPAIRVLSFPATRESLCEIYDLPVLGEFGKDAADIATGLRELGGADCECMHDFVAALVQDKPGVLEFLDKIADLDAPKNGLRLLVELAKDEIELRCREATADYGYMDARAEGYQAIRG